ncbi:uracil-DNA glycosylase [Paenibacillus chitinolyticus]|uniref:Uracil-DNA glycosylase n=1 Tax=Paenibacillus chitinolyticus TaxID=79263 RepID=A0A410X039_9BACL|nr:uracil-DNA glycosylase [Paenibacillus chitinolyticus]MCY9590039.1 uracil-DNA glycosylase [Paenibacillus chitinolyticus]MCY9596736.1 uracil-DNA glycosylase [Paenibacillus chitinolyticus]QAV19943.1 uracil-DNA glycosylase [Paenibacillus chitinolyticus]
MTILKNDWAELLSEEFEKPYYLKLREFLKQEYAERTIYPEMHNIFNALHYTAFKDVKAVILGQDPYHGPGQAHGLSFSVKPGVPAPPSLKNMFKEMKDDIGCPLPGTGYLKHWADQGVLLLNTVLTVRAGEANSHKGKGWELFTDKVIETLNRKETPVLFILWGSHAQSKTQLIDLNRHGVIKAPHPSPLSAHRGFFGSKPYSKANAWLREQGIEPIDWCLPE